MRLRIIGCTGSMSGPKSAASSYLLQAIGPGEDGKDRTWNILFDLGPGSYGQLWNYIDPAKLDALILSHLHADHCGDIISMHVFHRWAPRAPKKILPIYGPVGLEQRIRQIDGDPNADYEPEFDFRELSEDNREFQIGPFKISAHEAWHTVPTFGFRVEGPSGFPADRLRDVQPLGKPVDGETAIFAYTGDTDYCESIERMALGVDLLLAEAGFLEADGTPETPICRGVHMTAERTGQLANNSGVGALIATHIQPWTEAGAVWDEVRRNWDGPFATANAGAMFVV
ncbi:hypothetical protein BSR29_02425 [Boudabousia liubingyangii]|uniref:Metallo-beta-lactamase domain-containing protein n=1 Tax=Boudabousia liubingyangii TaxID=1921764 RepID=A0A1Q5PQC6_9ACTO|nr:MBL fold metallo-hydrolase [Boudabousia liubingyangii]OKL46074.1 hypothetical protein BSR28_08400 [Boudabousia liubingyangii]OKL49821.1 hypothetical protein BSR29_02425 [Boudabousia liubingyangii]